VHVVKIKAAKARVEMETIYQLFEERIEYLEKRETHE
jgi:hypothetical protein